MNTKLETISASEERWRFSDFYTLMKPTVSLLVVVTVVPGLLLASGNLPNPAMLIAVLIGTFLASGSAGVFNHFLERDLDEKMARTRQRPVATSRVTPQVAMLFGFVLAMAATSCLYWGASPLAAVVALAANAFYVLIYTLILKRRTHFNIVIGGAAGAVGPLIGSAAATGTLVPGAWLLFAIIFFWTPPHFWALALKYKNDYQLAGLPMLPVVKGEEHTRRSIFRYSLTLLPLIWGMYSLGVTSIWTMAFCLLLTLRFCWLSWGLYRSRSNELAMPTFHFSCAYLFLVFGAVTLDLLLRVGDRDEFVLVILSEANDLFRFMVNGKPQVLQVGEIRLAPQN